MVDIHSLNLYASPVYNWNINKNDYKLKLSVKVKMIASIWILKIGPKGLVLVIGIGGEGVELFKTAVAAKHKTSDGKHCFDKIFWT